MSNPGPSTPRDFLQRELRIGDKVVYPTRRGSSMWLSSGQVRNIQANSLCGRTPHTLQVATRTHNDKCRIVYIPAERTVRMD